MAFNAMLQHLSFDRLEFNIKEFEISSQNDETKVLADLRNSLKNFPIQSYEEICNQRFLRSLRESYHIISSGGRKYRKINEAFEDLPNNDIKIIWYIIQFVIIIIERCDGLKSKISLQYLENHFELIKEELSVDLKENKKVLEEKIFELDSYRLECIIFMQSNKTEINATMKRIEDLTDFNFSRQIENIGRNAIAIHREILNEENHLKSLIFPDKGSQDLNNLQILDLSHIQINGLSSICDQRHFNFKELNLSNNMIQLINKIVLLKNLSKLKKLDLSSNKIHHLNLDDFKGLDNLKELNLWNNQITTIHSNAHMLNLEVLNLNDNQITRFDDDAFNNLHKLKKLNLERNQIAEVNALSFKYLPDLTELNLNGNKINKLTDDNFIHLRKLEYLHLNGNQIKEISRNAFNGLKELLKLNLTETQIDSFDIDMFKELKKLNDLKLSTDQSSLLNANLFRNISNMKDVTSFQIKNSVFCYNRNKN